ncbi:Ribokinase [Sesamum alatum]|uniref:Ribokinase n=1 Tax=Sesamum alatum TaxID=300844 RepID=A0AAE1YYC7_9LAMI|nr:Ribokinase [Sesamum alatum]
MVLPSQSLDNPESAHHQERPLAPFRSPVGEDAHGKLNAEALEGGGVLLDHLSIVGDAPTGHAMVMLQADGQNSIIIVGGANMTFWLETLPPADLEVVKNVGIVLLQREEETGNESSFPAYLDA